MWQALSTPGNIPPNATLITTKKARLLRVPLIAALVPGVGPVGDKLVQAIGSSRTDQSSIAAFIEDNFATGRIGGGSSDAYAGTVLNMFDFSDEHGSGEDRVLLLDPATGQPTHGHGHGRD